MIDEITLVAVSFFVALASQVANRELVNKGAVRTLKDELKKINVKLKEMKPGDHEYSLHVKKMMNVNMQMMRHQVRPMIITAIPFLLVFILLQNVYSKKVLFGSLSWLYVYVIFTFVFSMMLQMVFEKYWR